MNLKHLSDEVLDLNTKEVAIEELAALSKMLHHLREIERRRLYSKLKYQSLFDYAVRRLEYSSDQADRRIAAMRLLKEIPEIESKISSGSLTLTNIGMARTLFRKEKFSKTQKVDFLKSIEKKSVRETARMIASVSPEALAVDKIRPVSSSKDEIKFTADLGLKEKLERLKGLLAHSHPEISLGELIDKLADLGLKEWTAAPRDLGRQKPQSHAGIRRKVWRRDQRCTNCGSSHALELDHRMPKGIGGASTLENYRLLCRKCNQRAAIEVFGLRRMENYLDVQGKTEKPVTMWTLRDSVSFPC